MRYTVLHAFLTYRIHKRLYLSALNLVNFLKTPCTTSPGRVCVVFRCRRFTRTQSSRNSAQPFLFWHRECALFCWIYGFTRTSGVTDSAALFFFGTNESICPHSCRCNRIICGGRMLSDNRILPTKESCVTFSCRRSFLLSPSATYSAHPADRAVPPHNTKKTAAPQRRSAANYPRRRNYFFAGSFRRP